MKNLNNMKKYFEFYGKEVIQELYPLCSVLGKSIPGPGSPCYETKRLKWDNLQVLQIIEHRTGDITIKTTNGYIKFWKK